MVLGYLLGYAVIAFILLPLYYRMGLTSIYTYLETRMGPRAYQTGAGFFLLSRTIRGLISSLSLSGPSSFNSSLKKPDGPPLRCRSHCRLQPSIFTPTGEASEPWCSEYLFTDLLHAGLGRTDCCLDCPRHEQPRAGMIKPSAKLLQSNLLLGIRTEELLFAMFERSLHRHCDDRTRSGHDAKESDMS